MTHSWYTSYQPYISHCGDDFSHAALLRFDLQKIHDRAGNNIQWWESETQSLKRPKKMIRETKLTKCQALNKAR